jgi:GNAT superfamily N-acetyltransferase
MRAEFLGESTGERVEPYAGYVDGRLVVTGVLQLPQMDNLDTANLEVATPPALRRRGYGTSMLEHLVELARRRGRRTLLAEASWDHDAPADGAGTVNADFLTGRGFAFSLGDVKRALELPVDEGLLDRLEQETASFQTDYTLRHFVGPVPDDIIDRFGSLIGSLVSEAPMGDLDIEDEVYDATRIRADEKILEASGRTKYTTVASAPDGELVAYTDLALPSYDPGHVYQWGTLVRPEHRGHRLGMAVKLRNLREFQAAEPGRRVLYTYNAEVNEHMIAVNEALGFHPVGRLGEFQRKL